MSVEYFLDKMLLSELGDILENVQFADRSLWEASRINSYLMCQMNTKKKLKLTDIYKLPFDDEEGKKKLTKEDFERMQKQTKALEDYLNRKQKTDNKKS